jgi:hypothetical protein
MAAPAILASKPASATMKMKLRMPMYMAGASPNVIRIGSHGCEKRYECIARRLRRIATHRRHTANGCDNAGSAARGSKISGSLRHHQLRQICARMSRTSINCPANCSRQGFSKKWKNIRPRASGFQRSATPQGHSKAINSAKARNAETRILATNVLRRGSLS